jgi:hypothetical protein
MQPPKLVDVHAEVQSIAGESMPVGSTGAKQPWEAPTLDTLPLSHTYNNISANSDGTNGS